MTREFGAPTIRDIAVQSMRLFRFCGAGEKPWSVGMHLLLVADLLKETEKKTGLMLEHHALLHDAPEVVVNDVPRPMKTAAAKALEAEVLGRIYESLGLRLPTAREVDLIHAADLRAVNVEGRESYGPQGFEQTQPGIDYADTEALAMFRELADNYDAGEALKAGHFWVRVLDKRLRSTIARVHQAKKQHIRGYTAKA